MSFVEYNVSLTESQKKSIANAYKSNVSVKIVLKNYQLQGDDKILVTRRQLNKLNKAAMNGTGTMILFSNTQLKKMYKQEGGFLAPLAIALVSSLAPVLLGRMFQKRDEQEQQRQYRGNGLNIGSGLNFPRGGQLDLTKVSQDGGCCECQSKKKQYQMKMSQANQMGMGNQFLDPESKEYTEEYQPLE